MCYLYFLALSKLIVNIQYFHCWMNEVQRKWKPEGLEQVISSRFLSSYYIIVRVLQENERKFDECYFTSWWGRNLSIFIFLNRYINREIYEINIIVAQWIKYRVLMFFSKKSMINHNYELRYNFPITVGKSRQSNSY